MKYLITSLSLDNVLEEGIQGVILMKGGRGRMGMVDGGDNSSMGSLGWFWVDTPATSWAAMIVTRISPSKTAFLVTYEAAVLAHVASMFNWG